MNTSWRRYWLKRKHKGPDKTHCLFPFKALTCPLKFLKLYIMLTVLLNSFYEIGNKIGHFGVWFFIILFGLMFLYAMVKYVKR